MLREHLVLHAPAPGPGGDPQGLRRANHGREGARAGVPRALGPIHAQGVWGSPGAEANPRPPAHGARTSRVHQDVRGFVPRRQQVPRSQDCAAGHFGSPHAQRLDVGAQEVHGRNGRHGGAPGHPLPLGGGSLGPAQGVPGSEFGPLRRHGHHGAQNAHQGGAGGAGKRHGKRPREVRGHERGPQPSERGRTVPAAFDGGLGGLAWEGGRVDGVRDRHGLRVRQLPRPLQPRLRHVRGVAAHHGGLELWGGLRLLQAALPSALRVRGRSSACAERGEVAQPGNRNGR
mmetsp:Transcript_52023/g.104341  ORF Transcript_52023/g.104341 Transcript_52023/m.104341 type:complete len:287 (+) Transcript_52023:1017-1877(+)